MNIFDNDETNFDVKLFKDNHKMLLFLKKKNLITNDPFVKISEGFPFKIFIEFLKKIFRKNQDIIYLFSAILENKNLSQRYIGKKPSQIFKMVINKEKEKEKEKEKKMEIEKAKEEVKKVN